MAGVLLGLAHWRMFLRNIQALQPQPEAAGRVKALAGLASGMRVGLTAGIGFLLVRRFEVDVYGLAAGLLASTYGFRVWAWRRAQEGTGH